jgi:hypothetical protein
VSLVPASSAEAVAATTANTLITATAATPQPSPRSSVQHSQHPQQQQQQQQQQQHQQRRNSSELVAAAIGDAVAALSGIRDTGASSSISSGDVCRLYVSDAIHPGYPAQRVDIKVRTGILYCS